MSNTVNIKLIGDDELLRTLTSLEYKTQHKFLKRVVKDTATKTLAKALRQASPKGPTGNLKRSMGAVSGKSKRNAVVFAGPRMAGRFQKKTSTNKGWVANIIEHNKGKVRKPMPDPRGGYRGSPKTPHGYRKDSGIMPTTYKGYIGRTLTQNLKRAENHLLKSVRTIIERDWNSKVRKGLI